jgi:NADPH-dependent 7-cyano-7-deazaguanine reductase QueF
VLLSRKSFITAAILSSIPDRGGHNRQIYVIARRLTSTILRLSQPDKASIEVQQCEDSSMMKSKQPESGSSLFTDRLKCEDIM